MFIKRLQINRMLFLAMHAVKRDLHPDLNVIISTAMIFGGTAVNCCSYLRYSGRITFEIATLIHEVLINQ